jgi:hypothetical protein
MPKQPQPKSTRIIGDHLLPSQSCSLWEIAGSLAAISASKPRHSLPIEDRLHSSRTTRRGDNIKFAWPAPIPKHAKLFLRRNQTVPDEV